jgi:hypothetical protein
MSSRGQSSRLCDTGSASFVPNMSDCEGTVAPAASAVRNCTTAAAYAETLAYLDERTRALQAALDRARCVGPRRRQSALIDLHHRVRETAALLNQALGAWLATAEGKPQ